MKNDYVPSNDGQFEVWFNNLVEYVLAGTPVWTHIPKPEAENLTAAHTAWHTARLSAQKPHTPVPRPDGIPETEALTPKPLALRFRRANMKRWGKPAGAHGLELVWLVADAPPEQVAELFHFTGSSRHETQKTKALAVLFGTLATMLTFGMALASCNKGDDAVVAVGIHAAEKIL